MDKIVSIDSVADFDRVWGVESRHPLVNVIEGARITTPVAHCRKQFGLYVVYLKDAICADRIIYGRGSYDYQENTLVFVGPGQVLGTSADGTTFRPSGWCLYFSPDLLRGTSLAAKMRDYTFFSYAINEALHISAAERDSIIGCLRRIDTEIGSNDDPHSKSIITSAIELLLNYCARFYDRQFATRRKVNSDVIASFEKIVDEYYASGQSASEGTLTVNWCAERLNLSPNYFGDLVRKETGRSPRDYIRSRAMAVAKELLWHTELNISQIAYRLGYQYPQYFTRAFKSATGLTPIEYRRSL